MFKALNYWVYGGFEGAKTPCEFIDFAAKNGLDGIELTLDSGITIDATESECRGIAAYAKEKGVALRSLASGTYWNMSIGADDATERAKAIRYVKKHLQIAAWLGCEVILVIPGHTCVAWNPDRPIQAYKNVWNHATASLKKLIPVAEKLKVAIGLENVWNRFLLSPMEWKLFLDQFKSKYVGLYFDVGNCCLFARPEDYFDILGNKLIKAVHLKNFTATDCAGGLTGFGDDLLKGAVDMKAVKEAMEKAKYTGPCTVEMIPFCRGDKLVLPDNDLALKMCKQVKKI